MLASLAREFAAYKELWEAALTFLMDSEEWLHGPFLKVQFG